jgi:hypothetical protein
MWSSTQHDLALDTAGEWHLAYSPRLLHANGHVPGTEGHLAYRAGMSEERIFFGDVGFPEFFSGDFGRPVHPVIEVGIDGVVHLAYIDLDREVVNEYRRDILYTNNASGEFSEPAVIVEGVANAGSSTFDMTIDAYGDWHIAYVVEEWEGGFSLIGPTTLFYMNEALRVPRLAFSGRPFWGDAVLAYPMNPRIAITPGSTVYIAFRTVIEEFYDAIDYAVTHRGEVKLVHNRPIAFSPPELIHTFSFASYQDEFFPELFEQEQKEYFNALDLAIDSSGQWHIVVADTVGEDNTEDLPSNLYYYREGVPEPELLASLPEGDVLNGPKIWFPPSPAGPLDNPLLGCNDGDEAGMGDPLSDGLLFLLTLSLAWSLHGRVRRGCWSEKR